MATATINVRMDADLKHQFEDFCDDIGMNMTTAINVFARQAVREYRIPFEIGQPKPNKETIAAFKEADDILKHPERYKSYNNFQEVLEDIFGDDEADN